MKAIGLCSASFSPAILGWLRGSGRARLHGSARPPNPAKQRPIAFTTKMFTRTLSKAFTGTNEKGNAFVCEKR